MIGLEIQYYAGIISGIAISILAYIGWHVFLDLWKDILKSDPDLINKVIGFFIPSKRRIYKDNGVPGYRIIRHSEQARKIFGGSSKQYGRMITVLKRQNTGPTVPHDFHVMRYPFMNPEKEPNINKPLHLSEKFREVTITKDKSVFKNMTEDQISNLNEFEGVVRNMMVDECREPIYKANKTELVEAFQEAIFENYITADLKKVSIEIMDFNEGDEPKKLCVYFKFDHAKGVVYRNEKGIKKHD